MSYPFCRLCAADIIPGRGCRCGELQEAHDAAMEEQRRERQELARYWAEVPLADAETEADRAYEARRDHAAEHRQQVDDFRRGND